LTGGASYTARTASQLNTVFAGLPKRIGVVRRRQEVTAQFAVIGAIIALAALAASIRWSAYP
jgi:hypothetical protein